jgi:hypothetical protein
MVVTLGDVLDALPGFEKFYPINDFAKLAEQIEALRESMDDHGSSWFVSTMKHTHLTRLLEPAHRKKDKNFVAHVSILARPRRSLITCTCCGEVHSPAAAAIKAFESVVFQAGAQRWTGKPEALPAGGGQ